MALVSVQPNQRPRTAKEARRSQPKRYTYSDDKTKKKIWHASDEPKRCAAHPTAKQVLFSILSRASTLPKSGRWCPAEPDSHKKRHHMMRLSHRQKKVRHTYTPLENKNGVIRLSRAKRYATPPTNEKRYATIRLSVMSRAIIPPKSWR